MKQKRMLRAALIIMFLVVIPSILFYIYVASALSPPRIGRDTCEFGEIISPYCSGDNRVLQKVCVDGKWNINEVEVCSVDEQCVYGVCFSKVCEQVQPLCLNDFERAYPVCKDDGVVMLREICGSKSRYSEVKGFCREGVCYQQPSTCGDGICQPDEDIVSCYRDCSIINDASLFSREISDYMNELEPYLQCDVDFDCHNPEVIDFAEQIIMLYNIPDGNPQMYMDAVVHYVNRYITYNFAGGKSQCGESASDVIRSRWGNCVDYSVLTVALLRAQGIPARQVAGCVSHSGWFCHTFAMRDISRVGGVPIMWDSDEQRQITNSNVVGGDVLGHSWIEVWLGKEKGWVTADPTVGDTISKRCIGYYPVAYGGTGEYFRDCEGPFNMPPCFSYALCHIKGDSALNFCRTY